ncbi:MAG: hypothetical protein MR695_06530 [Solobacterium sp.]|nr:hypothetical protein [Solobacterium sp.]
MTSEYTLNDEISTLRIWFDTKPFSNEIQETIKNLNVGLITDEAKQIYLKERFEKEQVQAN